MKSAAKVFIWIGMIIGAVFIYPLVVGILALKRINTAQNKEELQVFGILVTLFCSLLGGIFMLCIKDEELKNNPIVIVANHRQSSKFQKICTFTGLILLLALSIAYLILSISVNNNITRYGTSDIFIQFLAILPIILLLIVIFIIYLINHFKFTKSNLILLLIFTCYDFVLIFISALDKLELSRVFYSGYVFDNVMYMCSSTLWIIFALACLIFGLSVTLLILNWLEFKRNNSINNNLISNSLHEKLKYEIQDAEKLFVENVITKEEYEQIRKTIISKYYK